MGAVCGCCTDPVDFDGEVDLYHFDLHRAVGKGAFGKVCLSAVSRLLSPYPTRTSRSEWSNTRSQSSFTLSNTSTRLNVSNKKPLPTLSKSDASLKRYYHRLMSSKLPLCSYTRRSTTLSLSTFATPSKMTRTVSLCWISCWGATCAVRVLPSQP